MANGLKVIRALAVSRDVLYVVTSFENEEAHLAPSRLYQFNNGTWDYNEYGWMIQALALYRAPGAAQRALCIVSDKGDVLFPHDESIHERIVDAHAPMARGKRLGRISKVTQIGDHLYACGEGAQVYRRSDDGGWSLPDPALLDNQGDPYLAERMIMPDGQPFGGRYGLLAQYPDLARKYAQLVIDADPNTIIYGIAGQTEQHIFAAARVFAFKNKARMLFWDGSRFRDVPTDSLNPLIDVLVHGDQVLVCGREGTFMAGNERDGFRQLPCATGGLSFLRMAPFDGNIYLSTVGRTGLLVSDLKRLEPVSTDLKPDIRSATYVGAVDGVLWVVGPDDIVRFDGKTWTRIGLPPLTRPRKGRNGG